MTIRAVVASPAKYKSQNARATCCIAGPTKALMALPIREASYRQSKTEPREPTLPKLCAGQTCLTPACGQAFAVDCVTRVHWRADQPEKKPGKTSPALGSPFFRRTQLNYATLIQPGAYLRSRNNRVGTQALRHAKSQCSCSLPHSSQGITHQMKSARKTALPPLYSLAIACHPSLARCV